MSLESFLSKVAGPEVSVQSFIKSIKPDQQKTNRRF